ncbi:hypothetical protein SNE40_017246 [Patella caerulea]
MEALNEPVKGGGDFVSPDGIQHINIGTALSLWYREIKRVGMKTNSQFAFHLLEVHTKYCRWPCCKIKPKKNDSWLFPPVCRGSTTKLMSPATPCQRQTETFKDVVLESNDCHTGNLCLQQQTVSVRSELLSQSVDNRREDYDDENDAEHLIGHGSFSEMGTVADCLSSSPQSRTVSATLDEDHVELINSSYQKRGDETRISMGYSKIPGTLNKLATSNSHGNERPDRQSPDDNGNNGYYIVDDSSDPVQKLMEAEEQSETMTCVFPIDADWNPLADTTNTGFENGLDIPDLNCPDVKVNNLRIVNDSINDNNANIPDFAEILSTDTACVSVRDTNKQDKGNVRDIIGPNSVKTNRSIDSSCAISTPQPVKPTKPVNILKTFNPHDVLENKNIMVIAKNSKYVIPEHPSSSVTNNSSTNMKTCLNRDMKAIKSLPDTNQNFNNSKNINGVPVDSCLQYSIVDPVAEKQSSIVHGRSEKSRKLSINESDITNRDHIFNTSVVCDKNATQKNIERNGIPNTFKMDIPENSKKVSNSLVARILEGKFSEKEYHEVPRSSDDKEMEYYKNPQNSDNKLTQIKSSPIDSRENLTGSETVRVHDFEIGPRVKTENVSSQVKEISSASPGPPVSSDETFELIDVRRHKVNDVNPVDQLVELCPLIPVSHPVTIIASRENLLNGPTKTFSPTCVSSSAVNVIFDGAEAEVETMLNDRSQDLITPECICNPVIVPETEVYSVNQPMKTLSFNPPLPIRVSQSTTALVAMGDTINEGNVETLPSNPTVADRLSSSTTASNVQVEPNEIVSYNSQFPSSASHTTTTAVAKTDNVESLINQAHNSLLRKYVSAQISGICPGLNMRLRKDIHGKYKIIKRNRMLFKRIRQAKQVLMKANHRPAKSARVRRQAVSNQEHLVKEDNPAHPDTQTTGLTVCLPIPDLSCRDIATGPDIFGTLPDHDTTVDAPQSHIASNRPSTDIASNLPGPDIASDLPVPDNASNSPYAETISGPPCPEITSGPPCPEITSGPPYPDTACEPPCKDAACCPRCQTTANDSLPPDLHCLIMDINPSRVDNADEPPCTYIANDPSGPDTASNPRYPESTSGPPHPDIPGKVQLTNVVYEETCLDNGDLVLDPRSIDVREETILTAEFYPEHLELSAHIRQNYQTNEDQIKRKHEGYKIRKLRGRKSYSCDFCAIRFSTLKDIKNHIRENYADCGKEPEIASSPIRELDCKEESENGDKRIKRSYVCEFLFCDHSFTKKKDLKQHVKEQHGSGLKRPSKKLTPQVTFPCGVCEKRFLKKKNWLIHTRRHMDPDYKIPRTKVAFKFKKTKSFNKTCIQKHAISQRKGQKLLITHYCDFCEFSFTKKQLLTVHLNEDHPWQTPRKNKTVRTYHCKFCELSFIKRSALTIHQSDAHPSDAHPSDAHPSLNVETKFHTRKTTQKGVSRKPKTIKTLHCYFCELSFIKRSALSIHMHEAHEYVENVTPKITRTYYCNFCELSFIKRSALSIHMTEAHGYVEKVTPKTTKTHYCNFCELSFMKRNLWTDHMMEAHPVNGEGPCQKTTSIETKGFKKQHCHYCGLSFVKRGALAIHVRKSHPSVTNRPLGEKVVPKAIRRKGKTTTTQHCNYCELSFMKRGELAVHTIEAHPFTNIENEQLNEPSSATSNTPTAKKTGTQYCNYCELSFMGRGELAVHTIEAHDFSDKDMTPLNGKIATMSTDSYPPLDKCEEPPHKKSKSSRTERTTYHCHLCELSYVNKRDLSDHLHDDHQISQIKRVKPKPIPGNRRKDQVKKHVCVFCDLIFTQNSQLADHLKDVHQLTLTDDSENKSDSLKIKQFEIFPCEFCELRFSKKEMIKHLRSVHSSSAGLEAAVIKCKKARKTREVVTHFCKFCELSFIKKKELLVHIKECHRVKRLLKCDFCEEQFSKRLALTEHVKESHPPVVNLSIITGETDGVPDTLERDYEVIGEIQIKDRKIFSCDFCTFMFIKQKHLIAHLKEHHQDCQYQCGVCGKLFTNKSRWKTHLKLHEPDPQFKCGDCEKAFPFCHMLNAHRKHVHEHVKSHQCHFCGKQFSTGRVLRDHLLIHTQERPHICQFCNKAFTQAFNLKRHMWTHTGVKPYSCDICLKSFRGSTDLKRHRLIHNSLKPHQCELCDLAFRQLSHLNTHRKSQHMRKDPFSL